MRLRKLVTLLLVTLLLAGVCATAFAATNPDAPFMSDLKKLEKYLRKNLEETNLGSKAVKYMKAELPTMDVERLSRCLRSFLRCGDTVPLPNMLEAYAREISGDYYLSIYEAANEMGTSPDVAANQIRFDRGWLGSKIGAIVPSGTPDPTCPTCPACPCCR